MRVGVVGGGVVGLATAWYLRRLGAEPVVFEAGSVGGGCSHGNAGWVCPSITSPLTTPGLTFRSLLGMFRPGSPLYIRAAALPELRRWLALFRSHCTPIDYAHGLRTLAVLNARTLELYQELSAAGVTFESHRTRLLCAFWKPARAEAFRAEVAAIAKAAGVSASPSRPLDRNELYQQEPMLRSGFTSGLLIDRNMHVRPETLTAGLAEQLRSQGVAVHEQLSVTGFKTERRTVRALLTTGGATEVDAVVIAAGAESGRLAQAAGITIPLTAAKGYSITVRSPRNQLRQPLHLGEAKIGVTPYDGALRFSGTVELSGLNRRLDLRRVRALRKTVSRYLRIPEVNAGDAPWVGMRPIVPDTLPVTGKLPSRTNVYLNTGHQMLGMTLAPGTGLAVANMVLGEKTLDGYAPLSPARF